MISRCTEPPTRGRRMCRSEALSCNVSRNSPRNCRWCAELFVPVRSHQVWCSTACRVSASRSRAEADGRAAKWTATSNARKRRQPITTECVVCGVSFTHRSLGRRYCSNRCSARASYENRKGSPEYKASRLQFDQRRRARKRTAAVEVFSSAEIFERDRYRCHICRQKCLKGSRVPHPLAPTLDHLIPLAEDGEHTRANTATACFLCNSVKGDRGGGEQLAIC